MTPPVQQGVKQETHNIHVKNTHDVSNKETRKTGTKAPKPRSHFQKENVSGMRSLLIVSVVRIGKAHYVSKNHVASPHWSWAKNSAPNSFSSW